MSFVKTALVLAFSILIHLPSAQAQGGSVGNGGDYDEASLFGIIQNVEYFIRAGQGRELFPEVNPDLLAKTIQQTDIQIVKHKLKDSKSNRRTAVNYQGEVRNLVLFTEKSLRKATEENPAALVILVLHEFLNLINVELSSSQHVSSSYSVSSRIAPFASDILKGNSAILASKQFNFSAMMTFPRDQSLALQKIMLNADYPVTNLNGTPFSALNLNQDSKMDARLICSDVQNTAQCVLIPSENRVNPTHIFDDLINQANFYNQVQTLLQKQQQQQQQQQQQMQQQQQQMQQQQQQQQQQVNQAREQARQQQEATEALSNQEREELKQAHAEEHEILNERQELARQELDEARARAKATVKPKLSLLNSNQLLLLPDAAALMELLKRTNFKQREMNDSSKRIEALLSCISKGPVTTCFTYQP